MKKMLSYDTKEKQFAWIFFKGPQENTEKTKIQF